MIFPHDTWVVIACRSCNGRGEFPRPKDFNPVVCRKCKGYGLLKIDVEDIEVLEKGD